IGRVAIMQKIRRAEEIDDALDGAGLVEILALVEAFESAGNPEQRDEMTAGGGAPDANPCWIDPVLGGIRPEEPDGSFAVLDLGGKNCLLAETVFDTGHRVALRDQGRSRAAFLRSGAPAATMDEDDQRAGGAGIRRLIHIETLCRRAIGD